MRDWLRIVLTGAVLGLLALTGCEGGDQERAARQAETDQAADAEEKAAAPDGEEMGSAGAGADSEPAANGAAGEERRAAADTADESDSGSGSGGSPSGEEAANALGCTACHAARAQLVGPSYAAVAKRYNGDKAKILEVIKDNVKNGASGNWADVTGGTPMPPQPQAVGKTEQLEAIAEWIAGLSG